MATESKPLCYIHTESLGLMPYLKQFIPVYHTWMQDPEILELTASEPLTLEEEQENQLSWLQDPLKYTFIVFARESDKEYLQQDDFPNYTRGYSMAGDINLFFHNYLEPNEAEINVMIGEKTHRGKGLAAQAIRMIIDFGVAFYERTRFLAKISSNNVASIALFKKLGFIIFAEITQYEEVHYELNVTSQLTKAEFIQKYPGFQAITEGV